MRLGASYSDVMVFGEVASWLRGDSHPRQTTPSRDADAATDTPLPPQSAGIISVGDGESRFTIRINIS